MMYLPAFLYTACIEYTVPKVCGDGGYTDVDSYVYINIFFLCYVTNLFGDFRMLCQIQLFLQQFTHMLIFIYGSIYILYTLNIYYILNI